MSLEHSQLTPLGDAGTSTTACPAAYYKWGGGVNGCGFWTTLSLSSVPRKLSFPSFSFAPSHLSSLQVDCRLMGEWVGPTNNHSHWRKNGKIIGQIIIEDSEICFQAPRQSAYMFESNKLGDPSCTFENLCFQNEMFKKEKEKRGSIFYFCLPTITKAKQTKQKQRPDWIDCPFM